MLLSDVRREWTDGIAAICTYYGDMQSNTTVYPFLSCRGKKAMHIMSTPFLPRSNRLDFFLISYPSMVLFIVFCKSERQERAADERKSKEEFVFYTVTKCITVERKYLLCFAL